MRPFQRARHDHRIVVHAEDEDAGPPAIMCPDAANKFQAAEALVRPSQLDDDNVGMTLLKNLISGHKIAGGEDRFDPGIFEKTPAPLQDPEDDRR